MPKLVYDAAALLEQSRKLAEVAKTDAERQFATRLIASEMLELRDALVDAWEGLPSRIRDANPQLQLDYDRWTTRLNDYTPPSVLGGKWDWWKAVQAALLEGRAAFRSTAKSTGQDFIAESEALQAKNWPAGRPDVLEGWMLANQINEAAGWEVWSTRAAMMALLKQLAIVTTGNIGAGVEAGIVGKKTGDGLEFIADEAWTKAKRFIKDHTPTPPKGLLKRLVIGMAAVAAIYFGAQFVGGGE